MVLALSNDRHLAGEERRIAHDGRAYTFQAFLDHYAESTGRVKWNAASDDGHLAGDDVPWGHYIARHPQCQEIVGSGIVRAELEFFPHIRDPNRGGQLRLDYVFENRERVRCQLHPGNRSKDAKPIFTRF